MRYLLSLLLAALISSCTTSSPSNEWMNKKNGKIKVLATTAMIGDLVQQVGGEFVDVMILIQGDVDPHSYEMRKGDAEKFDYADVIFYNGLGLEHGASLSSRLKNDPKAHAISESILKETPNDLIFVDHTVDPHIWMDLQLWSKTVASVEGVLSKLDPKEQLGFHVRATNLVEEYLNEDRKIYQEMQTIPEKKRYLVTSHDAFRYYGKRYLATAKERDSDTWQIRVMAPEGLAPEGQVGLLDIQNMVEHLKEYDITVLFPESNISVDALKKIVDVCRKKGVKICIAKEPLYGDALGPLGSDAETLKKMVQHNAEVIYTYLIQGCASG